MGMVAKRQHLRAGRKGSGALPAGGASRWLALETSTRAMGIALYEDGQFRAETCEEVRGQHAEHLLPALEALLRSLAWSPESLTGIALSVGPGSFTGIRVGLATVKALAFGGMPLVVPVSTLAGLALLGSGERPVAALLDARREELYAAAWSPAPRSSLLLPESVYDANGLIAGLPAHCRLVVGEGALPVASAVLKARSDLSLDGLGETQARADAIMRLAAPQLREGKGECAKALVPRYVRRAEAEVQRTGKALED